jgi:hypothetical protein
VLAASGRHAILAECDTTLIALVNGDGRPKVLVKLMAQLLQKHHLLSQKLMAQLPQPAPYIILPPLSTSPPFVAAGSLNSPLHR